MVEKNLWGKLPDASSIKTPGAILLEQASLLEKMTAGVLICRLTREQSTDYFLFNMSIIAPSLNNYSFAIVQVRHDIKLYPLAIKSTAIDDRWRKCQSQEELEAELGNILSSELVQKVIAGLLAQIKSEA